MKWFFYLILSLIAISCLGDITIRYIDYSAKRRIEEIVIKSCAYYKKNNKFPISIDFRPQGIELEKKWIDSLVRYVSNHDLDNKGNNNKKFHDESIIFYEPIWLVREFSRFELSYNRPFRTSKSFNYPFLCKYKVFEIKDK